MKKEDKELLIRDVCSRLPYGVKCDIGDNNKPYTLCRIEIDNKNGHLLDFAESISGLDCQVYLSEVKPYLFPLSSMTERQRKEWQSLMIQDFFGVLYWTMESYNYLHKNHFDYRGLIEKGLALDATNLGIY